eukprot:2879643-Amphidinium_carterae.1
MEAFALAGGKGDALQPEDACVRTTVSLPPQISSKPTPYHLQGREFYTAHDGTNNTNITPHG